MTFDGGSGNPDGPADLYRKWFEEQLALAQETLIRNMKQTNNVAASNAATFYVFDRVMGKPTQAIEANVSGDLTLQHYLAVAALHDAGAMLESEPDVEAAPDELPAPPHGEGEGEG
jgi:hypothetical protein